MGKKRSVTHGATPAIKTLTDAGIDYRVHSYEHDPRTDLSFGMEAAVALGVDPAAVFKTLMVSADGRLAVGIVPVDQHLDLKAIAHALGAKRAEMADPAAAQRATGYVLGGISPLGQRQSHPTVLDSSALEQPTILVSGGRRGLDIELAPQDLLGLTGGAAAAIAKA